MNSRITMLKIFVIIIAVLWLVQLFFTQVLGAYKLDNVVFHHNVPKKEIIIPHRGNIYDSKGKLLVTTKSYYQLDYDFNSLEKRVKSKKLKYKDFQKAKQQVITIFTEESQKSVSSKKPRSYFENKAIHKTPCMLDYVEQEVHDKIISRLRAEKLHYYSSHFVRFKREYRTKDGALRLIGLAKESKEEIADTKIENSKYSLEGVTGIEASMNSVLNGEFGWKEVLKDVRGREVFETDLQKKDGRDGYDVYLTIDYNLQRRIEKILKKRIQKYKANVAMCTVMNCKTGEILVMSGISRKDSLVDSQTLRSMPNLPVSYRFEPGSTFKCFTMLSAIDNQSYDISEKIDCRPYSPNYSGSGRDAKRIIRDAHTFDEPLSGDDIIAHSSNVGIAKIAERVGAENFYKTIRECGFGQTLPTNLYGVNKGYLQPLYSWTQYSLHSISFGQEIATTQLQLANAYCALANGGHLLVPRIIKKVVDNDNNVIKYAQREELCKISKESSIKIVQGFMEKVFTDGTAKKFQSDIMGLAGKTGTAEALIRQPNGRVKKEYSSTFAGYFPADNPKYVVIVTYDRPIRRYRYSASSSLPTFFEVYQQILLNNDKSMKITYFTKNEDIIHMPNLLGLTLLDAKIECDKLGLEYINMQKNDSLIVCSQFPLAGNKLDKNKVKVKIRAEEKKEEKAELMPNFKGYSSRKVIDFCLKNSIQVDFQGSGSVYFQSIKPGTKIEKDMTLLIKSKKRR